MIFVEYDAAMFNNKPFSRRAVISVFLSSRSKVPVMEIVPNELHGMVELLIRPLTCITGQTILKP